MGRVPKSPPAWLKDFLTFCQKQNKKSLNVADRDKITSLFDSHWSAFAEHSAAEAAKANAAKPASAKKAGAKGKDPVSALSTAVKKMNEKMVTEADPEVRQRLQQGLSEAVGDLIPGLQSALLPASDAGGGVSSASLQQQQQVAHGIPVSASIAVPDLVPMKNIEEKAQLMSEATEVYTQVTTEIQLAVEGEAAKTVIDDVNRLYSIALRAIN